MLKHLFPSLATLLVAASVTFAQATPKGDILLPADTSSFTLAGSAKQKAELKVVDVSGQPFKKAWRVTVKERVGGEYNVQFVAPIQPPQLAKGDVVLMSGYARMIDSADESGEGRFSFVLEQAKAPNDKVFNASFGATRQWKRFDVPAQVHLDFSQSGSQFTVRVGAYPQTLEIGGVEVRKMPAGTDWRTLPRTTVDYAGRKPDAPWRKGAAERIEKLRKADLAISVVDAAGKPVSDATVAVRMKRHAFPFGSCYAPGLILGRKDDSANAEQYRKVFLENFNIGVDEYAMKWPGWVNPDTRKTALDAWQWMHDHGIPVRGHVMVWPGWKRIPSEIKDLSGDPAKLQQAILDHVTKVGTDLRGKVVEWDVVNEPFANHDLMDILGEDAMVDWFKAARKADPDVPLYLNETSVPTSPPSDERYTVLYDRAKRLKDNGAPITGVGMQAHFGQNVQPPAQLLGIYDRFEKLGLPVRITELDIDIADEQLQADYYRDFLTASFSHPNINGVLIWGFWESAHWRPLAAMYRKDWSPRPIAGVWKNLIFKEWWTNADGRTDASGAYRTRGFLGDYEVTIARAGKTTTQTLQLGQGGAKPKITLND